MIMFNSYVKSTEAIHSFVSGSEQSRLNYFVSLFFGGGWTCLKHLPLEENNIKFWEILVNSHKKPVWNRWVNR